MTHHPRATSLGRVTDDNRGEAVRLRREHLGLSASALTKLAGVDRGKLRRFEDGEDLPSERWINSVERALDAFEHETGHEPAEGVKAAEREAGFIRFTVEGAYGAKALVVEGPVANLPELEAAVDRIMQRIQGQQRDGTVSH